MSGPAHVFGISFVARLYRSIFASLGRAAPLFVYVLNPCRELWEDLQPARRTAPRPRAPSGRPTRQLTFDLGEAPAAASAPSDENPLLALWGRPGRDSIRLYNDLSDCDFHERFEDPAAGMARPTLLARLQREVLERAPRSGEAGEADGSLVIFGAPDPRRELETVAAEIWSLLRRDATLRFDDFAVVVPAASADTYLPLAREVFTSASELPHTVLDLPSPAEGHILDAVELLLALPSGPLGRRDLLQLAMHPAVARRFPDVDPELFLALCEQLAIVRGADGGDLAGSYLDQDRVSWDQGLRRLALGAFLSGRRSGEERPFSFGGDPVLAADLPAAAEPAARALGRIARELIDFARTARALTAPVGDIMALLRRVLSATIRPATPRRTGGAGRLLRGAGTDRARRCRPIWRSASASPPSWCGPAWPCGAGARARPKGSPSRRSRRCARCRSGSSSCSAWTSGCSRRPRGSVRSICAAPRRGRSRATSRRASRTSTSSSRRCCRRASGFICRTSRATRRRESGRIRRRRCWRCATCLAPGPPAMSCCAGSPGRTRRWRATATTPSARCFRPRRASGRPRRSASRCGRPRA